MRNTFYMVQGGDFQYLSVTLNPIYHRVDKWLNGFLTGGLKFLKFFFGFKCNTVVLRLKCDMLHGTYLGTP